MRLTTKGRFAVTAMIDLALRQHSGPVTLAGIADRQKISLSYLEQLFGKLRRNHLVASVRGPGNAAAVNADVPASWSATRTRPLCPYPQVARYNSAGEIESAASFSCR